MTNINTFQGNVGVGTSPAVKFDVNGITRVTNNSTSLQLVGTDHTFMEYYPDGIAAGRKSYVGYAGADDNNFSIQNEASSGGVKIITGGADRLTVDSGGTVALGGTLNIPQYIKHVGDENNLFGFPGTDLFLVHTAGADAIAVDASQNIDISGLIRHLGDTDTYFGFSSADAFVVRTNGSDRINVNNAGNVTLSVNLYIPDNIYHSGDTHTYFGFNGDNSIGFVTGGTNRLTINDSGTTFQNGGTALNYYQENSGAGAWNAHGQNGTGFNINGHLAYQRVGNFCTVTMRRVQFYAQGNFYLRHIIPSEYRPSNGYGDILAWQNRVTTNGAFWGLCYWPNQGNGAPYWYYNASANGSDFSAGNGTQHNFSAHSRTYLTN